MKIMKKDFPWIVIAEDKIGKTSLKPYTDIAIGFMTKNLNPTSDKDKYITTWVHTVDEDVLLRGSSTFENAYQRIKFERERAKQSEKQPTSQSTQNTAQNAPEPQTTGDALDDERPWEF